MQASSAEQQPLVSVVMSVYNNIAYLDKAAQSILQQSLADFEFIIIDDGSTDGSRQKLIDYAAQDPRIKLILNDKNIGLTQNLNKGLLLAKGQYIARMDGDDYAFPSRFEKQVEALNNDPNVVLVGTGYYTIDNHDKRYKLTIEGQSEIEVFWISLFRPALMHPSAMYRKSLISEFDLLYREHTFPAEDFDMWSRMLRHGGCKIIQEPLIEYRLHDNNISATKHDAQMRRTKEIVLANIEYYFAEQIKQHSLDIDNLTSFLYLDKSVVEANVEQAMLAMQSLAQHVANSGQLSLGQRNTIYKLAVRWLLKAIIKNHYSVFASVLKMGRLLPYLILEVGDIVSRRFAQKVK